MFKAVRVLQTGCLIAALAGCASAPVATGHTGAATLDATGGLSGSAAQQVAPRAPRAPSIEAGQSGGTTKGFTDAQGRLLPELQAYADEVATTRHIPPGHVKRLLAAARYNTTVVKLMTPSGRTIRRSWVTYRDRFVDPIRIKNGVAFWSEHRHDIDQAAIQYGIPPSILVAIIGVETLYGRYTGDFRVLDALATLGFRHPDTARPERSQLFRDQLADLIELDYKGELNALTATGSYAGAVGMPQFMPGSIRRFAADGDHDGKIDLDGSTADALASIGRFLRLHGWQPDLPVFAPVTLPAHAGRWADGGLTPKLNWRQLEQGGAKVKAGYPIKLWSSAPLGVVDLVDEPRDTVEYRVATANFFALTQYNRSYFYAASVADLAQALAQRMGYGCACVKPAN